VSFEDDPDAAAQRGYKPCRRCLPDQASSASEYRQGQAVDDAQAVLMAAVLASRPAPKLEDLAAQVGMSKFHLQRVFKKNTGMSPAEYARSLKTGRLLTWWHGLMQVIDAASALPDCELPCAAGEQSS
jgi:AraC family transcriptional regulator of adaptative response/methylated-DNA-[protein]-cysteine methyltransferase